MEKSNLKKWDDGIWTLEGDKVHMFTVPFETRAIIIRLNQNKNAMISPVKVNPLRIKEVQSLGSISYLIAPNNFHHLYLNDWKKIYPEATIWGPARLHKKRKDVEFVEGICPESDQIWNEKMAIEVFKGSNFLDEIIFLHIPSKTLIVTDVIQNHSPSKNNLFWKVIKRFAGILAPNGGIPKDLKLTIRNKALAKKSIEKILTWDFNRIILGHGQCIEKGGKEYFKNAFNWLI